MVKERHSLALDPVDDATGAMVQIAPSATSDRLCVASDSDFAIETKPTGSYQTITTGILPKPNRLGSCTEPVHRW